MSSEQILRIFVIRRWWIIACVIVGVAVGAVLAFTLPKVYDARAQVIVSVSDDAEVSPAESGMYVDDQMPTLLEISSSNDFAAAVAEESGVDRSPADVRKNLEATIVPDTSVIEIHAHDRDSDQARILADSAAKAMSKSFVADQLGSDNGMDVDVLQKAEADGGAVFPDPVKFLGFGALAGLVLGLIIAPLRHGLDGRIRSFADIRGIFDADLLAVQMRRRDRSVRRLIANGGAATSVSGLLARVGLFGRSRKTTTLALCGVGGVGNELAGDIVETAAANGLRCVLVAADSGALRTAHYRELSTVTGVSVIDANSGMRALMADGVCDALPGSLDDFDLVVGVTDDLAGHPETTVLLEHADVALVVTREHPRRAELRTTRELLRSGGVSAAGFVLVDDPSQERRQAPASVYPGGPLSTADDRSSDGSGTDNLAEQDLTGRDPELVTAPFDVVASEPSASETHQLYRNEGERK